jgi:DNA polymerase III epsilon subunit-like protein
MSDKRDLIVVDVETTGLDTERHWVIEVAAINADTGEELYFVPALPLGALDEADGKALKLNGYFSRDVYAHRLDTATTERHWDQLWDWLDSNTLAGSNPSFDAAMLNRAQHWNAGGRTQRRFSPWHHRLADLSAYAAGALGISPTAMPGLEVVCRSLHVENLTPHSAMGDARATVECFRKLAEKGGEK